MLVADILFGGGLACFLFVRGIELMESFWYRSDGQTLITIGFIVVFYEMLSAFYHVMVSRTYANVFENRLSGIGMQGIQSKSFHLRSEQIAGVSISKGFLNIESGDSVFLVINTAAGNYKIITSAARAKEILDYYSGSAND